MGLVVRTPSTWEQAASVAAWHTVPRNSTLVVCFFGRMRPTPRIA